MGVQTYEPGHSRMYTITRGIGNYVETSDYVALERENAVLKARLERLSAPVSDEEWERWSHEVVIPSRDFDPDERFHVLNRTNVNNLLAARLSSAKGGDDAK